MHMNYCVYVAVCDEISLVKVGRSGTVYQRVDHLTRFLGSPVRLVTDVDPYPFYAGRVERAAHALLGDRQYDGEWFSVTPDEAVMAVYQAREECAEGGPDPVWTNAVDRKSMNWLMSDVEKFCSVSGIREEVFFGGCSQGDALFRKVREGELLPAPEFRKLVGYLTCARRQARGARKAAAEPKARGKR